MKEKREEERERRTKEEQKNNSTSTTTNSTTTPMSYFYSFKDTTIEGKEVDFNRYKGKVCLVVNTACNCGLGKKGFELIREAKKNYPELEILLFPSALNYLVDQEIKNKEEIISTLKKEEVYDISTVFEKRMISTDKTIFKYLSHEAPGIFGTTAVKWNFTKFIISSDGLNITRFSPNSSYSSVQPLLQEYFS